MVSGVLGVVLGAGVMVMLAWRLARLRRVTDRASWQLAAGVLFLAAGASLGIPSLTANRAGTLVVAARPAGHRPSAYGRG